MRRPLFLIGLGGFGKWVVTAFKKTILDTYGKKPADIDWLSFDLVGQETPPAQYDRFELGKVKKETLDFSPTSQEFIQFSGNFSYQIQKVREGTKDARFAGRLTKEDADMIIVAQEHGIPAAERRHASMIQFVLDIDKVAGMLKKKLREHTLIFLVNSLAGGTGTGTFIDFLLLIRKLLAPLGGTIISILLLPYGFSKVKQNEDMNPLYGNCYAAFRELLRLFFPKGNVRVSYSLNKLELQNITKPRGLDAVSDLVFLIDGSRIGGQEGSAVEYYRGIVPSIANFIESSFLALETKGEKRTNTRTETFFDNAKTHAIENFTSEKAKENPYNAFSFASFGSYRLLFDSAAVKTEFAQRIAIDIFDQFLAPSYIPDIGFAVKNYLLNTQESTQFDKDILHDCVTKLHQILDFATFGSLKSRLEYDVKFPDFGLATVKVTGKVRDTKKAVDKKEDAVMGNAKDRYEKRLRPTFNAAYNYYKDYYPSRFKKCIQKKVLEILKKGENADNYGKGNLKAAEHFTAEMIGWFITFLRGIPERGVKAQFTEACESGDQIEGTYEHQKKMTDEYHRKNQGKGRGILSDPRKQYIERRVKLNELLVRDLSRKLIIEIASEDLAYLERLHRELIDWVWTFEQSKKNMQDALNALLEVRNARKDIVCDEYLSDSQDTIEQQFYTLITDYDEWKRVKESPSTDVSVVRLKEIIDAVPHRHWAEFVKGFTWDFNLPDERGRYPSNKHKPENLVCFVEAGMPDFPAKNEWDRKEYIRTWNYELVQYYLTHHRLNELDQISAFQILMLRQDDPNVILERLKTNSAIMLFCDDTKKAELIDADYAPFGPESHFVITGDFGYQDKQPKLKEWIESFEKYMNAIPAKEITKVNVKEKSHEISFTTSEFCLPAPAMVNLASTEVVYLERMKKKLPPPLHIFRGEKEAYDYETKISKRFRTTYEKLHPQVVSILENDVLVRRILLAQVLGLIKEGKEIDQKTHKTKHHLELTGEKFSGEKGKLPYLSDLIYDILYPSTGRETAYKNLVEDLGKEVNAGLKKLTKNEEESSKAELVKELKTKIEQENIPQREKDLYKVWTIMLSEG